MTSSQQRRLFLHRHDLGARHHHIGDLQLAEFEQIGEHHPFLLRQGGIFALAFLDHFFQAFAHRGAGRVSPQEAAASRFRSDVVSLSSGLRLASVIASAALRAT